MLHSTHCIHQLLLHWNLCQWNSALAIALLVSPTAIITSTNIHLFYNVFLMEHINCLCCCLACYSFSRISVFILITFSFLFPVKLYYTLTQTFSRIYCIAGIVIVCNFVRSLMAFVCQEIKDYLLTKPIPACRT